MAIQVVKPKREDMMKCIARFDDIKGASDGIPDMQVEEYHRTFHSVIGFEQPKGEEHIRRSVTRSGRSSVTWHRGSALLS
jgi:hypothetical protein